MDDLKGRITFLDIRCIECKDLKQVKVGMEAYKKWQNGLYIQDAFPELSAGDRELMISGICGECYDKMFKEEE